MVSSVDVARLAGVSQATVSRVLNNPDKVNTSTVDKVNAAIKKLNYRPNAAARSLISRKSGVIALLCGPLNDPENAEFANKAISYAQERGFIAEIHVQDPLAPEKVFETIVKTQAEGVIAAPLLAGEDEMALLNSSGLPFVLCGMECQEPGNYISMDNRAAGKIAADYISSFQHKLVGWLGGSRSDRRLQERYEGFMASMKESEVEVINAVGEISDYDAVLSAMMARKNRPTAIVAATDAIGAYAIDFLMDYGYTISKDIAVLGIGNSVQSSRNYLRLTSIGLPVDRDIFKEAMDQLLAMIEDAPENGLLADSILPELFTRASS